MKKKFSKALYRSFEELSSDVKLMIDNCYQYNGRIGFIANVS
jgi:hypothetical protein